MLRMCCAMPGPAPDAADPIKMLKVLREDWGAANGTSVDGDEGGAAAPAAAAASAASDGGNVIITSTFDAFVDAVLEALPRLNLTVVTGVLRGSLASACRGAAWACC